MAKTINKGIKTNIEAKKNLITATEHIKKETEGIMAMNATLLRQRVLSTLLNDPKDINEECGYPDEITISMYKEMYKREGVAKRVVNILPEDTWSSLPEIYETEKSDDLVDN